MSEIAPPGGFTAADLAEIDAALLRQARNPVQQVRFSDGRQLTYRSVEELLALRRFAEGTIRAARPSNLMGMARLSSFRRN